MRQQAADPEAETSELSEDTPVETPVASASLDDPLLYVITPLIAEIPAEEDSMYPLRDTFDFLDMPPLSKYKKKRVEKWIRSFHNNKDKEKELIVSDVSYQNVASLLPGMWLQDEILYYCMENFITLFCADQTNCSTFIFPLDFVSDLFNIGDGAEAGKVDPKKGMELTQELRDGSNLVSFDNIIFWTNHNEFYWNLIVIFPKLTQMEIIDCSLEEANQDWNLGVAQGLFQFWGIYCKFMDEELDEKEWSLYHSRPCIPRIKDGFQCGPYSILSCVAIHHRLDMSSLDSLVCEKFRRNMLAHFSSNKVTPDRMCTQWKKKFPLEQAPADQPSLEHDDSKPPGGATSDASGEREDSTEKDQTIELGKADRQGGSELRMEPLDDTLHETLQGYLKLILDANIPPHLERYFCEKLQNVKHSDVDMLAVFREAVGNQDGTTTGIGTHLLK